MSMKKIIIGILISCLFVIGCNYHDLKAKCYHGKIIMSSCCTGSTFIELISSPQIGKKTTLNGQEYQNAIQVPGYINNGGNNGDIYLNLRAYDPDKDHNIYPMPLCYCLVAVGMDVPVFVATAYSYSTCPNETGSSH